MPTKKPSPAAERVIDHMLTEEQYHLTASRARMYNDATNELMDAGMIRPHTLHGDEGYTLTTLALNLKKPKKVKAKAEPVEVGQHVVRHVADDTME